MKKVLLIFLTFISTANAYLPNKNALIEANAAYVFPLGRTFQDIYTNAGYYRLQGTLNRVNSAQPWVNNTLKYVKPWTSVGLIYTSGTSIGADDGTRLYLIPFDIGLNLMFPVDIFYPYLGGGIELAWTFIRNNSAYVQRNQSSFDVGATAKIGTYINPNSSCFFVNLFCEYTWLNGHFPPPPASLNVKTNTADLSRISLGGGIGFSF